MADLVRPIPAFTGQSSKVQVMTIVVGPQLETGERIEVVPASALQALQEIEGYLSAEMGDGQLPPRVKDRIDKAYAAARVALGKNPSP